MANTTTPAISATPPPDPAAQAKDFAMKFYAASNAVDVFRLSQNPPPDPTTADRLERISGALDDCGDEFLAEGIADVMAGVQTDLDKIKQNTQAANAVLSRLKTVDQVISISALVLSLGTAIPTGNVASILAASQALVDGIAGL